MNKIQFAYACKSLMVCTLGEAFLKDNHIAGALGKTGDLQGPLIKIGFKYLSKNMSYLAMGMSAVPEVKVR
ncbi:MAG: hypothetical protein M0Z50_03590 [Planctomycetia bacterium]|jgi:hypothetical protein|nr:hypothetical protein [Planctomycetia bacterium]